MRKRLFTEEEVLFLKNNYSSKTREELAKELNRPKTTVTQKLIKLGLKPLSKKKEASNTWKNMYLFAKKLNPNYKKVTDAFSEHGMRNFINLYKQSLNN